MNNSRKLERIRQWIENKPAVLVNTALSAATSIDSITYWLQYDIKQKEAKRKLAIPDPDVWLKLYRKSFSVQFAGAILLYGYRQGLNIVVAFRLIMSQSLKARRNPEAYTEELAKEIQKMGKEKFLKRTNTYGKLMFKTLNNEIDEQLNELVDQPQALSDKEDDTFEFVMASQEISFFLRVWLPCFVLHHTEPIIMMKKARQGDMQALENLLRIDKMVLFEPKIRDQYIHAKYSPINGILNRISKAFTGRTASGVSRKKVKKQIAHFVHQMFGAMNVKLSVSDVQEFFDALAAAKGLLRDEDIISEEALKKALERAEPWPVFSRTKNK